MSQQTDGKFNRFFLWIYNHHNQIIGAGFLIGKKEVATCAHVVRVAFGLQDTPVDAPKGAITLSFPFLKWNNLSATVLAEGWSHEKDIAILRLSDDLSEFAQPAKLYFGEVENHSFSVYGFPGRTEKGVLADGVIKGKREHGLVQIESTSGYAVQGGFSGGPVFDDQLNKVVGMVATSDLSVKVSSMIPVDMLASVCNRAGVNLKLNIEAREKTMNISPREICENCLKESFTARDKDEFILLCMNFLPSVGRKLDDMRSIDWMINVLLDHCRNNNDYDSLWMLLENSSKNAQYDKFYPEWKKVTFF